MSTVRIQLTAVRFADIALMPFALGSGCALYVAVGRAVMPPQCSSILMTHRYLVPLMLKHAYRAH